MSENINITIGSDPEFVIMCGDLVENALEIFTKVFPDIDCSSKKEIADYYVENKIAYLEYALLNMELEYLKNNYREILKNHSIYGVYETANIILNYYLKKGYPEWDELPSQVQYRIISIIEEEYIKIMNIADRKFCSTELGCDGQSVLGEMRPKQGNNPIEHFNEILKLMKKLNDLLSPEIICYGDDELQVKAGGVQRSIWNKYTSSRYELAGHIHLGYKPYVYEYNLSIQELCVKYLSIFVGIPLTLIVDKKDMFRHEQGHYGQFGSSAYKSIKNGNDYDGIEFRMPSSWLVSPLITIGALSLAYVVFYDYIQAVNKKDINTFFILHKDNIRKIYAREDWNEIKEYVQNIKYQVKKMQLYPEYKEYIDYIFDMIDRNETWHSEKNILPLWAEMW